MTDRDTANETSSKPLRLDEITLAKIKRALNPLAEIARAWRNNALDESRPEAIERGVEDKREPRNIELFQGRGGRELLTLADAFEAERVLLSLPVLADFTIPPASSDRGGYTSPYFAEQPAALRGRVVEVLRALMDGSYYTSSDDIMQAHAESIWNVMGVPEIVGQFIPLKRSIEDLGVEIAHLEASAPVDRRKETVDVLERAFGEYACLILKKLNQKEHDEFEKNFAAPARDLLMKLRKELYEESEEKRDAPSPVVPLVRDDLAMRLRALAKVYDRTFVKVDIELLEDAAKELELKATEPVSRWPFRESPGNFAARLLAALGGMRGPLPTSGDMLAAVRYVLIERPPALAAWLDPGAAAKDSAAYNLLLIALRYAFPDFGKDAAIEPEAILELGKDYDNHRATVSHLSAQLKYFGVNLPGRWVDLIDRAVENYRKRIEGGAEIAEENRRLRGEYRRLREALRTYFPELEAIEVDSIGPDDVCRVGGEHVKMRMDRVCTSDALASAIAEARGLLAAIAESRNLREGNRGISNKQLDVVDEVLAKLRAASEVSK